MKTHEEIKKDLAESAEFLRERFGELKSGNLMADALAYIQQLEAELKLRMSTIKALENTFADFNRINAKLIRERDAAVKDLKSACKLLWDDYMQCCKFCEHQNAPKESGYCDKCYNGNRFKFKPAALCPENTEVQEK